MISARRAAARAGLISADRRLELLMGYHPLALMPPPKSTPQETGAGSSSVAPVPAIKVARRATCQGWLNAACAPDGARLLATRGAALARALPPGPEPDYWWLVCTRRPQPAHSWSWSLKCLNRS